mmetsp:Transcript_23305/g.40404  ORF Transcript_23305/g.40404 Transcript_23305/m.40404 type:complete len:280 (+) Transcript_23305:3621-4460(+)
MGADQNGFICRQITLGQGDMLNPIGLIGKDTHVPRATVLRMNSTSRRLDHEVVMAPAIGNQITDGPDLEPVGFGVVHKIRQAGHLAIFFHDLADHTGRIVPRQTGHVTSRFGMASPHQHAALSGAQRKHMARRGNIGGGRLRVDRRGNGQGTIRRGNAGADTFAGLDRHGKGRLMTGRIVHRHHRQTQRFNPVGGQGYTDQSAPMGGHEVHRLRRGEIGRDHQIALVLPVLMINQNEHTAQPSLLDDLFDRRNGVGQISFDRTGCFKAHGAPVAAFPAT